MIPETPEENLMRCCDTCSALASYEPIIVFGRDLCEGMPFLCPTCEASLEQREIEAARLRIRERRQEIWTETVPARYRETDPAFPGFNQALWEMVRHMSFHKSVALIGPSGRSKTRVFALLAKRAISQDYGVGWCPANRFQWAAQREFHDVDGPNAQQWMRKWLTVPVLFLDDLGKHKWTDTVESAFFNLLETRSGNNLPTHWSMNPDPADVVTQETLSSDAPSILARALDPTGAASARARFAPILSRLLDGTTLIPVP
jgi:hypothetical protein